MSEAPVAVSERVLWSQILVLVGYSVMCLLSVLLLGYLRVRRRVAFRGDANATRKVILPAYEPLLWILAATTGVYVVFFCTALKLELYTKSFPKLDNELFYAGRQFVFVLILAFLYQKSVSLPAVRRATIMAVLLATYTVPMVWLFTWFAPQEEKLLFFTNLVARPMLLLVVGYVCLVRPPAGRASSVALRAYAVYVFIYHVLLAAANLTKWYISIHSDTYAVLSYTLVIWGSLCPLLIWRLLRDDTEYWRGMGERVCSFQRVAHTPQLPRSHPSMAVDECISSRGIHVLIEMHRKFVIDFAHLELKRKIGTGASADVFAGLLRSKEPVAVKVYTPRSFTEETVAEFSHEAALCASLSHPNIARFLGMCVCPPTICLVSELCQGTLEDMLRLQAQARGRRRVTRHLLKVSGDIEGFFGFERQQMLLNVAYMLDCARAVAYVHSFSPPFLHRDIRPANFLVDADSNVKLTDFGESRRLPRELPVAGTVNQKSSTQVETTINSRTTLSSGGASTSNGCPPTLPQAKMTVTGTVDYVAPEMIGARTGLATYGEAADVYSLAITFWDVLHPDCEKYPTARNNHLQVLEGVLEGRRPPIDEECVDAEDAVPSELRNLIMSSWNGDATARPTAKQVVRTLEAIQEELLAVFA